MSACADGGPPRLGGGRTFWRGQRACFALFQGVMWAQDPPDNQRLNRETNPMPAAAAKKILLVDDDDNLRRTLAEQLALDGEFEAEEAATATEGLQKAKAGRFDAILLDVGLPDG